MDCVLHTNRSFFQQFFQLLPCESSKKRNHFGSGSPKLPSEGNSVFTNSPVKCGRGSIRDPPPPPQKVAVRRPFLPSEGFVSSVWALDPFSVCGCCGASSEECF